MSSIVIITAALPSDMSNCQYKEKLSWYSSEVDSQDDSCRKIVNMYLNLPKLCRQYCRFFGHGVEL